MKGKSLLPSFLPSTLNSTKPSFLCIFTLTLTHPILQLPFVILSHSILLFTIPSPSRSYSLIILYLHPLITDHPFFLFLLHPFPPPSHSPRIPLFSIPLNQPLPILFSPSTTYLTKPYPPLPNPSSYSYLPLLQYPSPPSLLLLRVLLTIC